MCKYEGGEHLTQQGLGVCLLHSSYPILVGVVGSSVSRFPVVCGVEVHNYSPRSRLVSVYKWQEKLKKSSRP